MRAPHDHQLAEVFVQRHQHALFPCGPCEDGLVPGVFGPGASPDNIVREFAFLPGPIASLPLSISEGDADLIAGNRAEGSRRAALLRLLLADRLGDGVENTGNSLWSAEGFDELPVEDHDLERTSRAFCVLAATQLA
jgi:hypothetical protein